MDIIISKLQGIFQLRHLSNLIHWKNSEHKHMQDNLEIAFYLPDMHVQQKFIDMLNRFGNALEQTRQHKAALIDFKKGLLNELIG